MIETTLPHSHEEDYRSKLRSELNHRGITDLSLFPFLTSSQRMVIEQRILGSSMPRPTLSELGVVLGITKQRVGQIEKEAARKILRFLRRTSIAA